MNRLSLNANKQLTIVRRYSVMSWLPSIALGFALGISANSVFAADDANAAMPMEQMDHSQMDHSQMDDSTMDHSKMDHSQMGDSTMDHSKMDHSPSMKTMDHAAMSGMNSDNSSNARDPHANSGGFTLSSGPYDLPGPRQLRLGDEHEYGSLMVDRLEALRDSSGEKSGAFDISAWYGHDYDRTLFKTEGDYNNGGVEEMSSELLRTHALSAYWDGQLGVRYDSGDTADQYWLAFGVRGLAPYWFEVDATAYLGRQGRTAINVETEYEILLTQKLILQPRFEANLYGKENPAREIGAGLSEVKAGLRLRYEIRREFAPYIGFEWQSLFGKSADYLQAAGEDKSSTRILAGLRFWL